MRIDILCKPENGTPCERTLANVRTALDQAGVKAEVHLYRDQRKMIDYRAYMAPALVVDDSLRIAGRIPEVTEIKRMIAEHHRYSKRLEEVA